MQQRLRRIFIPDNFVWVNSILSHKGLEAVRVRALQFFHDLCLKLLTQTLLRVLLLDLFCLDSVIDGRQEGDCWYLHVRVGPIFDRHDLFSFPLLMSFRNVKQELPQGLSTNQTEL